MSDKKNKNLGLYRKKQLVKEKCEKLLMSIEKHRKNGDWPLLRKHLQKYIKLKEYETLKKYGIGCNQFLEKLRSLFESLEFLHIDKWKNHKTHKTLAKSVLKRPKAPKIETDMDLQSLCLSAKDDLENDQTLRRLYEIQILLIATIMLTVKLREEEKRCKHGSGARTIWPPKDRRQYDKANEMDYPFHGYNTGQYYSHGWPDQPETYDGQDFLYSERQFLRDMYDLNLKERSRGSFLSDQSTTYDRPERGDKYPWILRQHSPFGRSFDREPRYPYQRPAEDDFRHSKPQAYLRYTRYPETRRPYDERYGSRPELLNKKHKRYSKQQPYPRYEMANKSTAIGPSLLDVPSSEKYNKSGEVMKPPEVISKPGDIQPFFSKAQPSEIYNKSGEMKKSSEMVSKSTETESSLMVAQLSEKYNKSGELMKPSEVIIKSGDLDIHPSFSKAQLSEKYDKKVVVKKSSEMISKYTETESSLLDVQFSEKYDKSGEVRNLLGDKSTITAPSLETQPHGKYRESSDTYSSRSSYENKRYYAHSESRYPYERFKETMKPPYPRTEIKDSYRRIDMKSRPTELRKRMARRRKVSYSSDDQSNVERIKSFINQMYVMRNLLSIPSSEYQNIPEKELLTRKGESERKPLASKEHGGSSQKPRKPKRKHDSEDGAPSNHHPLIMIRDSKGQSYLVVPRRGRQIPTEFKKFQVEMSKEYKKSKEKQRVSPQSSKKLDPLPTEILGEEEKSKSSPELFKPEKSELPLELLEPQNSVEGEKSEPPPELLELENPIEQKKSKSLSEIESDKFKGQKSKKSWLGRLTPDKSKSKSSSVVIEQEKPKSEELDKKVSESDEDEEGSSTTTEKPSGGGAQKIKRIRKRKTFKFRDEKLRR